MHVAPVSVVQEAAKLDYRWESLGERIDDIGIQDKADTNTRERVGLVVIEMELKE